jgi:hypothetical protein
MINTIPIKILNLAKFLLGVLYDISTKMLLPIIIMAIKLISLDGAKKSALILSKKNKLIFIKIDCKKRKIALALGFGQARTQIANKAIKGGRDLLAKKATVMVLCPMWLNQALIS